MPWYSADAPKPELDYSLPIVATHIEHEGTYILLPQIAKNSYLVTGYNWFNMQTGTYDSSRCYPTPKEAIASRTRDYTFHNAKVKYITL